MLDAVDAAVRGKTANTRLKNAVKEATIAGLVAFLLFVAIVGLKTENAVVGFMLVNRLPLAIGLAAGIAVCKLLANLFLFNRLEQGEAAARRLLASDRDAILAATAGLCVIGGYFFLVPGSRTGVVDFLNGLFAETPIQSNIRIFADLTSLLLMVAFVVAVAMGGVMVVRRIAARVLDPRRPQTPSQQRDALIAEYSRQFVPALFAIAVALPLLVAGPQQSYALDIGIQVVTYIMLGWGLNIVVGLAGLLDLGYVAFYAVGAYSYALISTTYGWSFWVCLPLAGVFAALWGILLGFPVLRLRGDYLAIVTLAFGEMIRIVLLNWVSLTNGPNGISRIPKLSFFGLPFSPNDGPGTFHGFFGLEYDAIHRIIFTYYVILMLALIVNFVSIRLRRLPIGRAWEALREDEVACRSLGINPTTTKLTAFAIGAMFGGLAGAFFATRQGFISPESFTFNESALVLAIVVLGGMGSQIGVALAAAVLIGSSEFFRDLQEYRMMIFGASMVLIMLWRPRGIIASRTPSVVLKVKKAISGNLVKEGAG